jgi:catechol 2,3-dioxygenase-like lactoylglutathione lyase family enzyme
MTMEPTVDLRLEVVVVPVEDVDRAKAFYAGLGWRLDADVELGPGTRIVQFTPPGSDCSIHFGSGLEYDQMLIVRDIDAARAQLNAHGADVTPPFHRDETGAIADGAGDHASYSTYASFADPDGNRWLLQEITTRLPGRLDAPGTTYASHDDLEGALRRAAAAHGEHEARTGEADENWPDWYADYMIKERAGAQLPV